jgi:undecaprenyl-diphosphatase
MSTQDEFPMRLSTLNVRLAAITVCLLIYAMLATVAYGPGTLQMDDRILTWVQVREWAALETAGAITNWLFDGRQLTVMFAGSALVCLTLTWRLEAFALVVAGSIRVVNGLMKEVFDSPRPGLEFIREAEAPTSLGFPSGHTAGAMLLCGTVVWIVGRRARRSSIRLTSACGAAAAVAITGLGRMMVGAHWPSDVLGGLLWASAAVLALTILLETSVFERFSGTVA